MRALVAAVLALGVTACGPAPMPGEEARAVQPGNQVEDAEVAFQSCSARHWSLAPAMGADRSYHTATTLADGSVLIAGGNRDGGRRAERYLPGSRTWVPAGSLTVARRFHAATRLADGRVLVVGGSYGPPGRTAEIYDPTDNRWRAARPMHHARIGGHAATLLPDGRVLVSGGANELQTEIFDPIANAWSDGPSLAVPRSFHLALRQPDGKVILVGGNPLDPATQPAAPVSSRAVELFDPVTNRLSRLPDLVESRVDPVGGIVGDRMVVVGGGRWTSEAFDHGDWEALPGELPFRDSQAVVTPEGALLVVGGFTSAPDIGLWTRFGAGALEASSGAWTSVMAPSIGGRLGHTLSVTGAGDILLAGGAPGAPAEVFTCAE